ncbi:MAG: LapA family protein [Mycobacterium sp.]
MTRGDAFVVCVATFALGDAGAGVAAAIVAVLAFGAGLDWLAMDRRRIRQAEREWPIGHAAR